MNEEPTIETPVRYFTEAEVKEAIDEIIQKVKDKQGWKNLDHSVALQSITDSFKFQMYKKLGLNGYP